MCRPVAILVVASAAACRPSPAPAVHGIVDNRMLDPENKSDGAWFWYARDIKVPTLPMAARAAGLRAAGITWPVTVGMDMDYLVLEFLRSEHPEALSMLRALSHPRHLMANAETARGKAFGWPQTDRDRTDLTTYMVKSLDPNILLLHLIELDDAQHNFGPGSPQTVETLTRIDGYVAEIVEAARASGRPTHIAIVSDHGFLPLKTLLQPNAVFTREGLLTLNEKNVVTSWKAYFHSSGGSGFVYVKDAADRERVHKVLLALKQDSANGIREIWTRAELDAKGAHPDAAFGLDVVDGFYTGGGFDAVVKPSTTKGGHGFAPDRAALHASFILTGPTVNRRGNVGVIRMTQIAPTLARSSASASRPRPGSRWRSRQAWRRRRASGSSEVSMARAGRGITPQFAWVEDAISADALILCRFPADHSADGLAIQVN